MKKLLTSLMAITFIAGLGFSASSMAMKHMAEATAKACKDKKPGDMVKVDGKDVKCPEPKKEEGKKEEGKKEEGKK
jgi:hypothetical protein